MGERRGGEARIALLASWAVVLVVVVQGTVSMLSQVTDELTALTRAVGVLSGLGAALLFVLLQRSVVQQREPPPWMVATAAVLALLGFTVGAWLTAALALGALGLAASGARLLALGVAYLGVLVAVMLVREVHPIDAPFFLLVVTAIGFMLYVLTRLAITVAELARARESLARMRVDEERHRISRELHDVLGRSLVAVSLRVQTAMRVLPGDPARCEAQLGEVARMLAEGQSSLRGLTHGTTVAGFAEELATARDLFERLQIACTSDVPPGTGDGDVDPVVDDLGARVLRECVTNVLKHARPTWVDISLRLESSASVLVVANDGAPEERRDGGTGLTDLATRAVEHGAVLEAGLLPDGRFRVIARMPRESSLPAEGAEAAEGAEDTAGTAASGAAPAAASARGTA